ncbi:MAG: serine/threonine protein kinase [Deltaproteobacteria bacterium]|nr:serine/threonine protein kinase [Deltaproteobacteria bacterium]
MSLDYPRDWYFDPTLGHMPQEALNELLELVTRVAAQAEDQQAVYEIFKGRFGNSNTSSNASWAHSDMVDAMGRQDRNLPAFIDAYWTAMTTVGEEVRTPTAEHVNAILRKHRIGYAIRPPKLVREVVSSVASTSPEASSSAPTYLIGECLGRGGFGEVRRATRESAFGSFEFAVKLHLPSALTDIEKARKRFEREVAVVRKLQHRAIVPYVDAGLDGDGRPFLVMALISGKNLREATFGQSPALAVRHMIEVLGAIEYAHANQVLHRDLKPSNILVRDSDGQAVVVDFGLAYVFDDATQESLTTAGVGTAAYVPHEVLANPKLRSPGHDIYSCGVILYEVIAGQLPDRANYHALANRDGALAPIDAVITKALAPAGGRYPSVAEFKNDLLRVVGQFSEGKP